MALAINITVIIYLHFLKSVSYGRDKLLNPEYEYLLYISLNPGIG